jgi:tryptophanyl-tRNA synthetase
MTRVLTAVQPTNQLTLGNYLGVIKELVGLQNAHECFIFIADLHAVTVPYDPAEMRANVLNVLATYLASGLDPLRCVLFLQSQVHEHAQLKHLLSAFTGVGDLFRMHQYKEKKKAKELISLALLDYPVLMAADILLYQPDLVPVGIDQLQHLELARDIAERFNSKHSLFKSPQPYFSSSPKIMSLQNPLQKMSKSDSNPMATIFISDSDEVIKRKFRSAVTDSGKEIVLSEDKPGIRNLLLIQAAIRSVDITLVESEYRGKLYGCLKSDTADVVISATGPIREKIKEYLSNEASLLSVLRSGRDRAKSIAGPMLEKAYAEMGFSLR